ncbi:MAG: prepilin peptidase [Janthinobacterium lividum]
MHFDFLTTACVLIALLDLGARRVPNLVLLVLAVLQGIALKSGLSELSWSHAALGALLGLCALLPFYAMRLMGAGDVKFAAVLGWMTGPGGVFWAWVIASLVAGAHALLIRGLARSWGGVAHTALPTPVRRWRRQVRRQWRRSTLARWSRWARQGRRGIPYAAYLALGAWLARSF